MKLLLVIFLTLFSFSFHENVSAGMINRKQVEPTGAVIWEVPKAEKKVIALTFDDGPNRIYTPKILAILKQYDAKATFFPIGYRMEQFPQVVQQVVQAGHELGNHTMTHRYENKIGLEQMRIEIIRAENVIQKYQQNKPKLYRPPGGYIDNSLLQVVQQQGYKVILWSYHQDPHDYALPGAQVIADHVIRKARSGDVVLLHDGGGDRSQTVQALKIIIPSLQKQGYEFVSVSDLLR